MDLPTTSMGYAKEKEVPSQWKRRQEFIARKVSSTESKKEANATDDKKVEVIIEDPVDEIELEEIKHE